MTTNVWTISMSEQPLLNLDERVTYCSLCHSDAATLPSPSTCEKSPGPPEEKSEALETNFTPTAAAGKADVTSGKRKRKRKKMKAATIESWYVFNGSIMACCLEEMLCTGSGNIANFWHVRHMYLIKIFLLSDVTVCVLFFIPQHEVGGA